MWIIGVEELLVSIFFNMFFIDVLCSIFVKNSCLMIVGLIFFRDDNIRSSFLKCVGWLEYWVLMYCFREFWEVFWRILICWGCVMGELFIEIIKFLVLVRNYRKFIIFYYIGYCVGDIFRKGSNFRNILKFVLM